MRVPTTSRAGAKQAGDKHRRDLFRSLWGGPFRVRRMQIPRGEREAVRRVEDAVMLVTGSTDGIGKETAGRLAGMGATVLVHARSTQRGQEALEELRERTGSRKLGLVVGDLSSLAEVRGIAEQVEAG